MHWADVWLGVKNNPKYMASAGLASVLYVFFSECCSGGFSHPGPSVPIFPFGSGVHRNAIYEVPVVSPSPIVVTFGRNALSTTNTDGFVAM